MLKRKPGEYFEPRSKLLKSLVPKSICNYELKKRKVHVFYNAQLQAKDGRVEKKLLECL